MFRSPFIIALLMTFLMSGLSACSESEQSEDRGASTKADFTEQIQSLNLKLEEPSWKLDTTPVNLTWFVGAEWYGHTWGESLTSKYVTQKTGVNIEFEVSTGEPSEMLSRMLTTGSLPDLITIGSWESAVNKLRESNLIYALDELANQYDPYFYKVTGDGALQWYRQEDGHTYVIPNDAYSPEQMRSTGLTGANQTFLVRKDLYESMGKPDLTTPKGFLNALQLLKNQYSVYKGQLISPFWAQGNASYGLTEYLQNLLAIPHEQNGKVYDRMTDPDYIEWLKTFRTAYEQGLINVDFLVDSSAQVQEKTNQAQYFMMIREWTDISDLNSKLEVLTNQSSYYIAVDGPRSSRGESAKLFPGSMDGWMVTMISKSTENPERAIRFLTYLASEEGQRDLFLGKEGETWAMKNGKPQLTAAMVQLHDTDRERLEKEYGIMDTYWMLRNPAFVNKWRPENAPSIKQMEEFANQQADLDSSIYKGLDPIGDSDIALAWSRISQNWEEVLPELITAKDEAAFDKIFENFLIRRVNYGFNQVMEYRQAELELRKAKIAR
ncbi:extracellular solute-binding protein [Paenibacillus amylolyticus]|uniref:extracellular solute-binding protein n=1 Tax=Paenibacillus amylolyticus TaxID=1451 RepID=UPI00201DCE31|nr:extracellular solute-binding protein [Paenibacillus amylolyticus]MCL6663864.1 extracellular solute-binding protein [Paenibacillus amylolyticus]